MGLIWKFVAYAEDQPPEIVASIAAKLQEFSPDQLASVKIAMSDQKGNPARGVVFWEPAGMSVPPSPAGAWATQMFASENDYDGLYNQALDLLNKLEPAQSLNARVTFTNRSSGDATVTVFYPSGQ